MIQKQVTIVRYAETEGSHWRPSERDHAVELYDQGYDVRTIANKLGKTARGTAQVLRPILRKRFALMIPDCTDKMSHQERMSYIFHEVSVND